MPEQTSSDKDGHCLFKCDKIKWNNKLMWSFFSENMDWSVYNKNGHIRPNGCLFKVKKHEMLIIFKS